MKSLIHANLVEVDLGFKKAGDIILLEEGQAQDINPQVGTVFIPQDGYEYLKGKKVWFHHFGYKKQTEYEGKKCFVISADEIYAYEDGKALRTINHIVCKPIVNKVDTWLETPFDKDYLDYYEVLNVPLITEGKHQLFEKLEVGDVIITHNYAGYPLTIDNYKYVFVLPKHVVSVNDKCTNDYLYVETIHPEDEFVLKNKIFVKAKEINKKEIGVVHTPDAYGMFPKGTKIFYVRKNKYAHPLRKNVYYTKIKDVFLRAND